MFAPTTSIRTEGHDIVALAAGACPAVKGGSPLASQHAAAVASAARTSGPALSTPSLRSLLSQRSTSCGHGVIVDGHSVLSAGGLTTSVFTTSEQGRTRDAARGTPAAGISLAGRCLSFVQLARGAASAPPPLLAHGYASESGAALMQPKPQPTTQLQAREKRPFLNSAPTREGGDAVVPPALLPAIEPDSLRADAAAATARLVEREVQLLLQPCGDPWLPLEAAWQRNAFSDIGGSRPAGINLMPTSATSRLEVVEDDSEEDEDYNDIKSGDPDGPAIDASAGRIETDRRPPVQGARVPPPTAQVQQSNRHRACEFGYTNSAPVDAAAAAKREIEDRFLRNMNINPALAGRRAIAGALSAPTAAPTKATATQCTTAPPRGPRGDRLTPEGVAAGSVLRPAGVGSASKRTAQPSSPTAASHPMARKTPSSARSTRLSLLNAAMPPLAGAAWPAGSSGASHSIAGPWPGSALPDVYDHRSIGSSNYFGAALAVGLSSLLDTIATEGPSSSKPQQTRGQALTPRRGGAWARARRCARSVGSRLLRGCFSGGDASTRG